MNTRSSSAGRKCLMTVECASQRSENHCIVPSRQAKLKNGKSKEISKFENDCKRKSHLSGVDEDEPKRKHIRLDNVKQDLNCGVTTRSNVKPAKPATTQTPDRSICITPESSKSGNKRLTKGRKPKKRQWESWAPNEKDCFFEALSEHSKDFDKIHTYLNKRRGDVSAAVRNKDQVRHFYYRTLNKISKYIPEPQDPSDAKKTYHEVRSLICYGELRKKFRSLKEKDGKKLTELISTGKTTLRYNGRNVHIRAPTCRALKKLSANVTEDQEHVPQKLMIELIPHDTKTWSIVQGMAHNPRLRTTVSSRKTVCSLISYLLSKWKLQDGVSVTLSPCVHESCSKQVGNKTDESEPPTKVKQVCDGNDGATNVEKMSETKESTTDKHGKATTSVTVEVDSSIKSTESTESPKEKVKKTTFSAKIAVSSSVKSTESTESHKEKAKKAASSAKVGVESSSKTIESTESPKERAKKAASSGKGDITSLVKVVEPKESDKAGLSTKASDTFPTKAIESTQSPEERIKKVTSLVEVEPSSSAMQDAVAGNDAELRDENLDDTNEKESSEDVHVQDTLAQERWDKSNSGNLTIADIYRMMGYPRKILLNYTVSKDEPRNDNSSTSHALEQLVKIAARECIKGLMNVVSSSKANTTDTVVVSKSSRVTKPKSAVKPQKPLAPKPPQEVLIPTVVTPVNSSTKPGNHLTFSFTPINSLPARPSPFLPKTKKRQASRVVVQRTLLPRGHAGVFSAAGRSPTPFVPSPTSIANQHGLVNSGAPNKARSERKILPKDSNVPNGEASSTAVTPPAPCHLTVDSLINIAMSENLPEHLESLILSKSLNLDKNTSDASHVCTEEIDSGVAGHAGKSVVMDVEDMNDAMKHLENKKQDAVEHSVDLLDNLKSSEDEDPFKFLSPSHLPNFPPESWLNEESTDFSLGTLFANLETSPVKQKPSNVLDTPKKPGAASDSDSKYSHTAPMFCDLVDENSVDYVKKFRDLAKKMGNDPDSSSSDNVDSVPSSTLSFKSLLSHASKD